jgi:hypothetical protein
VEWVLKAWKVAVEAMASHSLGSVKAVVTGGLLLSEGLRRRQNWYSTYARRSHERRFQNSCQFRWWRLECRPMDLQTLFEDSRFLGHRSAIVASRASFGGRVAFWRCVSRSSGSVVIGLHSVEGRGGQPSSIGNKRNRLQDRKRICEPTYDIPRSDIYQDFSENHCGVEIVRTPVR